MSKTAARKLIDAEDALDYAIRNHNHKETTRIEAMLPKLREAAQAERSREQIRKILGPLKQTFGTNNNNR